MPSIPTFDNDYDVFMQFAEMLRWPSAIYCPVCNSPEKITNAGWRKYTCRDCHFFFNVKTNTVLHGVKTPLPHLAEAINIMCSDSPIWEAARQVMRVRDLGAREIFARLAAAKAPDPTDALGVLEAALQSRMTVNWEVAKRVGLDPETHPQKRRG